MIETFIIGNVGSIKFFERAGETSVLNISLASSRKINDREYTDWISGKLWGVRAEKLREHIAVGMKLMLRGRPEAKGFQKTDGTTGGELVLHINELEFLSPKREDGDSPAIAEEQPPLPHRPMKRTRKEKSA